MLSIDKIRDGVRWRSDICFLRIHLLADQFLTLRPELKCATGEFWARFFRTNSKLRHRFIEGAQATVNPRPRLLRASR